MKKYKFHWLFTVLILSLTFGVIHKVGAINMDAALYDPLTTEAVDKAWQVALNAEQNNGTVKAPYITKTDVEFQLGSFQTVYDKDKKVVGSSGEVDGQTPELPADILDNTDPLVRNYFTWEPKEGVHVAGVAVSAGDYGFVVAGKSMQEYDRQADRLLKTVLIGWVVSVALATTGFIAISRKR